MGGIGRLEWGRSLEPWVAEVGIAAVSVAILALAIGRGATAHLYPAASGWSSP